MGGQKKFTAACPCCGYVTFDEPHSFKICDVCGWHDDGQDNNDADEVSWGLNFQYSLTQARKNFLKYGCKYDPGTRGFMLNNRKDPKDYKKLRDFDENGTEV